jgi:geranylgeranyl diphosphate synthase type II
MKEFFSTEKITVDNALEKFLPEGEKPRVITDAMRYSIFAGGKRLRPILLIETYRTLHGNDIKTVLPAACAVEMIHTYSLIHDDLPAMDDDDFRRGKPSCHKKFGEAIAILAGDALFARAYEILQKTKAPPEVVMKVNNVLSSAVGVEGIIGGQVMDIVSSSENPDKEILHYIHTHKTAKFISACMEIGAILSGTNKRTIDAIKQIGNLLGLSFQIVDDILDVKSTKATLGKTTNKDQSQNKLTYPAVYGTEESIKKSNQLLKEAKTMFNNELGHLDTSRLETIAEFIVNRIY